MRQILHSTIRKERIFKNYIIFDLKSLFYLKFFNLASRLMRNIIFLNFYFILFGVLRSYYKSLEQSWYSTILSKLHQRKNFRLNRIFHGKNRIHPITILLYYEEWFYQKLHPERNRASRIFESKSCKSWWFGSRRRKYWKYMGQVKNKQFRFWVNFEARAK